MKRTLLSSFFILLVDQMIKWYFQINFEGKELLILNNFGFTYTVNYGIWIDPDILKKFYILLQLIIVFIWIFGFYLLKYYHTFYRKSILVDLSFAFFTTAVYGNLIDRILFGYVRDYFINPIAISNFADICGEIAIIFLIIELMLYPKSRKLLKVGTPKEWYENTRIFVDFVKGKK